MKRTLNRFLVRFALLCVAIILGAIAVAQAQRGMESSKSKSQETQVPSAAAILPTTQAPIKVPFQEKADWTATTTEQVPIADQSRRPESLPPATVKQIPAEPEFNDNQYAESQYAESQYAEAQYSDPEDADPPYQQVPEVRPAAEFTALAPADHQAQPNYELQPPAPTTELDELNVEQPGAPAPEIPQSDFAEPQFQPESEQLEFAQPRYQQTDSVEPEFEQPEPNGNNLLPVQEAYDPPTEPQISEPTIAEQYIPPDVSAPAPAAPFADEREPHLDFAEELPARETTYATPTQFVNDAATLRPVQRDVGPAGVTGTGKPGTSELEGPQVPNISVVKGAPDEIQVGKSADFQIQIRNVGSTTTRDVTVRDEIPAGTELMDTSPPAHHGSNGELIWQIGELQPGEEQTVSMRVMPKEEGDIGSVAQVYFAVAASGRAHCTRPQIALEHVGPRQVLVGEDVVFKIKLTNPGTGIAHNVIIEEDVPPGLRHSAGKELEYAVGSLRPGETRLLELTLQADKPGQVDNVLVARADANLKADHSYELEVIAPLLRIGIQGPRRRFLEREADFDIAVQNPGTASAKNVDLVAHLPRGFKFKNADHQGEYNAQSHTVHWTLAELPANEMGTVRLTAVPTDMGDQKIRVEGKAAMNLSDSGEHIVTVDGLAALLYTVKDLNDPIEVGGNTTYEIRVVNQGSKTATNLILAAQAPAGMHPVSGEGPTRGVVNGQRIIFAPLARLAPQGETSYRVNVKATQPGDMRLKFRLVSDEVQTPVTKEESTHVYSDE